MEGCFFQRDPNDQRTGTLQLGKVSEQNSLYTRGVLYLSSKILRHTQAIIGGPDRDAEFY